ncbi:FHA domain-containing protein [Microbacterium sp. JB110]|uniref:FHA domain-containing protein n=1 Tax=Microbacterium sp. JB110 TaxID=2024477 RepID=UPI000DF42EF4|nr:FHA domain-containing protein [Microbacterium sp. JB110]RCS56940.1 FHA domain-containing protein [Microbacterium sp. JB110]
MIRARYTPGPAFLIVAKDTAVLLPPTTPAEMLDRAWLALHGDRDELDELLGSVGDHVLIAGDVAGVRVVVRGDREAVVTGGGIESQTVTGSDGAAELAGAELVSVALGWATPNPSLPLLGGVVGVASVEIEVVAAQVTGEAAVAGDVAAEEAGETAAAEDAGDAAGDGAGIGDEILDETILPVDVNGDGVYDDHEMLGAPAGSDESGSPDETPAPDEGAAPDETVTPDELGSAGGQQPDDAKAVGAEPAVDGGSGASGWSAADTGVALTAAGAAAVGGLGATAGVPGAAGAVPGGGLDSGSEHESADGAAAGIGSVAGGFAEADAPEAAGIGVDGADGDEVPDGEGPSAEAAADAIDSEPAVPEQPIVRAPEQAAPAAPRDPDPADSSELGDHDGNTVLPGELAAIRNQGEQDGDHDGITIAAGDIAAMRRGAQASPPAPTTPAGQAAARPPARVRLSTGAEVALDRPVLIGRRPRSVRSVGEDVPHLITVASPMHDISRNHIEIKIEDDVAMVTDLDSTNGTLLYRDGDPQRLHPGERTILIEGDALDVGEGITVTFQGLP